MAEGGAIGKDGLYATGLRAGHRPTWPNTLSALRSVFDDGIALRGAAPSVARGMLMAASQLASYDHSKHVLRDRLGILSDGPSLHLVCSQISALCATVVTAPADMLKTRVMGDRTGRYAGSMSALATTSSS